jgi:poly(U)-specific endoribonuclease
MEPDFDLDVSLSDAIQKMWDLDVNRLTPGVDYNMNVQDGKKPYWKEDSAPDPLFSYVDKNALKRPTYRAFMALLDNYKAETGATENETSAERTENWTFLKSVLQTAPMQFCHKYLLAKNPGEIPEDPVEFRRLLFKIWFELYRRGASRDSSGFEHVFVGEVKNDSISGFHNWLQFYFEEQKGTLDYRGYIKPRCNSDAQAGSDDHILSLQFSWNGIEKFVGTSFIGVSPEFEMAVYSTCFLLGEEENDIVLNTGTDEFHLKIKCYKMARDKIGTAFPEATAHYD